MFKLAYIFMPLYINNYENYIGNTRKANKRSYGAYWC